MEKLIIDKSLKINAPALKVWQVLTVPALSKQWIEQFWPGFGTLESDWKTGSEMYWKTADGNTGLIGKIIDIAPGRMLRYSFTMPQDIVTLTLQERINVTVLSVTHGDFADKPDGKECYLSAVDGWDMNLQNIKELAENL